MQLLLTPVELTLPADGRLLRLARLVATGVASACGLPVEDVEDFRTVVDEVCSALVEVSGTGRIALSFRMERTELIVEGWTEADPQRELDADRLALSHVLLDVLTDSHRVERDGDRFTFVVSTELRANGVG
jgi:anti-sigma regulatory factor (Ser/Thr protein kinase)